MTVIASNISAMRATAASTSASLALSTSMQRLSTGNRINSAKDDAAGLAISDSMTAQIKGMAQGIRNANDGISLAQTAEGALNEVGNMLQRMRELKVQSSNGTYSTADKTNITNEQTSLAAQIKSVISNTKFNGQTLFDTTAAAADVKIQTGASDKDTVNITLRDMTATYVAATTGASAAPAKGSQLGLIVDFSSTATTDATALKADPALGDYDKAIADVSSIRAGLGATQNRLQSAVNSATSNMTNLAEAKSRISDTDFSEETTALAKAQILSQASTAMLSQANQSQQGVLKLLG
ncbi:flagellin [Sphingomonas sp. Sph1(2015)]|jgi:flagellin|uniref:flagellin N-terminal helical domain-containing protein n=1 Tax=Sphingomonas sp. Sph1(2015) TaxID=1628084 RepID=UPI00097697EB|nr:flagellin [Sphingomonas sp. Sph1(2015)]OMJ31821.1 flagellin [Sphingomonas sp. Sph1(2015)]